MIVVGVCGQMNSGKNVAADVLIKQFDFHAFALAAPIKEILHGFFDVPSEELYGSSEKRSTRTREMLQALGTDFGRHFDPDIWVRSLIRTIKNRQFTRTIVTDVRFPNEAHALIREFDAKLIKIVRPKIKRDHAVDHHQSETAVNEIPDDMYDKIIMNDSTLPMFKKRVRLVAKGILDAAS